MPFIQPTIVIDLISSFWAIVVSITLFIWLPIKGLEAKYETNRSLFLPSKVTQDVYLLGWWLRNILLIFIGVLCLGRFNLLSWLTLTLLYLFCLTINYLQKHDWQLSFLQKMVQNQTICLIDFLDRGLSFTDILKSLRDKCRKAISKSSDRIANLIARQGIVFFIVLAAVLSFTLLLRWEYPLAQLRFSHPDNYNNLLITRQLLAKDYPNLAHLPVIPSLAAVVALLGSIEPMQTVRFLSPFLGLALVLSLGYMVRAFTNNAYSTLVTMFTLGVYLFTLETTSLNIDWLNKIIESLNNSLIRQWTGNELELGAIFLLLGLGYCFRSDRPLQKTLGFKINLLSAAILVGICAPSLLIILAIACIGAIGDKKLVLTTITLTWILLAVFAAMSQGKLLWLQSFLLTLPTALSLLVGLLFGLLSDSAKILSPKWGEIFCLGLVFSLSVNFLLPLTPNLVYVEYDMAARKSLEIKKHFPAQSWTLVAPVEQLTEIYGAGWYEDLALFVENYADKVHKPEFDFPISGTDLFVMVEKLPFVTFPDEPDILPDSILSDRTYQYYRSSAGRASLEYEAFRMCRAYSRSHSARSSVYYEDKELKIYHFSLDA